MRQQGGSVTIAARWCLKGSHEASDGTTNAASAERFAGTAGNTQGEAIRGETRSEDLREDAAGGELLRWMPVVCAAIRF